MARQLVPANIEITERAGLCLQFARRVFGLKAVEPTAHVAIQNLQYLHKDRSFPKGVTFPVWFEWWGQLPGDTKMYQYDHAAVIHTGGKVWSSPLSGTGRAWFNTVDDLIRAFGGGMKYIGWSEDISGVRVIEGENDMTPEFITTLYWIANAVQVDKKTVDWHMKNSTPSSLVKALNDNNEFLWPKLEKERNSLQAQLAAKPAPAPSADQFIKITDLYIKK